MAEPVVASDERRIKSFCERDVRRVVSGQIGVQLPHSVEQRLV
jgi:hypothetical protein